MLFGLGKKECFKQACRFEYGRMLQAGIRAWAGEIFSFRHSGVVKDQCSKQAFGLKYSRNLSSRHSGLSTEECLKQAFESR